MTMAASPAGRWSAPRCRSCWPTCRPRRIDVIVVYKVDRLTRSLADFAKLVELFDAHGVSFVSVTQSFNTTTSMGRLTLNVLLSFAQFEREVTGERIRDKIAASKKKGMWMGGVVPLGYRVEDRALHIVEDHAELVRGLFRRYLEVGSVVRLKQAPRRREPPPSHPHRRQGPIDRRRPFQPGPHLQDILEPDLYRPDRPQGPGARGPASADRRSGPLG